MSSSKFKSAQSQVQGVADGVSAGGGVLRMALNRDDFTTEHAINIVMEHAASVNVTTFENPFALIEKLEIETDRGVEFTTNGIDLAKLNEIFSNVSSQRVTLGAANRIELALDVFSKMPGASFDLLTAMETGQRTKYNLIITLSKDCTHVLTDGTLSGVPTYTVNVEAKTYPEMNGMGEIGSFHDEDGDEIENELRGIGSLVHRIVTNNKPGATSGPLDPIHMTSAGSLLRICQLSAFDTTGVNPVASDDIISGVRIVAGGREVFNSTFKNMQARNERSRKLSRMGSGFAFADFGDDVNGWLDMGDVKDARLFLTIAAGAPAGYEVRVTEDYVAQA